MESPYDAENPLLSAYRLGVLHYIAYTAVGTPCYNKNAFLPPVNQGGIIPYIVILPFPSYPCPANGFSRFKVHCIRYLSQKYQPFRNVTRPATRPVSANTSHVRRRIGRTDGFLTKHLFIKAGRMGNDLHPRQLQTLLHEFKSPCVIIMAMGEHQVCNQAKVDSKSLRVFKEHIRIPRIKQKPDAVTFNIIADRGFPQIIPVYVRVVINQYP